MAPNPYMIPHGVTELAGMRTIPNPSGSEDPLGTVPPRE
jgi:hypothetical protein